MSLQETTFHQDLYTAVECTKIQQVSKLGEANMFVKDETTQLGGSFKIRGAFNKALTAHQSTPELLQNGLITASRGNHAQGVAMAATYLETQAHIYLPHSTAQVKVDAITQLGATIHFVQGAVDDALINAREAAAQINGLFIHPFDDEEVINGQASIGDEIAADQRDFSSVFVPVGGGGLLAGVSRSLLVRSPDTKVYGAQLEGSDAFAQSVEAGKAVELNAVNDLADGTAVRKAGAITLKSVLASANFESIIRVTNAELGCALVELEALTGIRAETAAGLAFAGMRKHLAIKVNQQGNHLALVTGRHRDEERFKKLVAA